MVSEAKIDANRRNAEHSTGPKTAAGKARSSMNAATHGLTARTNCLPGEDPEVLRQRIIEFRISVNPRTPMEGYLADRVAIASHKLDRCDRGEVAGLTLRVLNAPAQSDADAMFHARDLFDRLGSPGKHDMPLKIADQLVRTEEGVELALQFWRRLRQRGDWSITNQDRALWLLGTETCRVYDDPIVAAVVSAQVVLQAGGQNMMIDRLREITRANDWNKFKANRDALKKSLPRPEEAMQTLTDLADGAIVRLEALLPELQAQSEQRRQLAADAAMIDDSKEGVRRRQYVQSCERAYRQALDALNRSLRQPLNRADSDECAGAAPENEANTVIPEVVAIPEVAPVALEPGPALENEPTAEAVLTGEMFISVLTAMTIDERGISESDLIPRDPVPG